MTLRLLVGSLQGFPYFLPRAHRRCSGLPPRWRKSHFEEAVGWNRDSCYQTGPASLTWIQQLTQNEGNDPLATMSGCSPGLHTLLCSAPGSPPAPRAPDTQSAFECPAALISAESGCSGGGGTWETHQQNKDAHVSGSIFLIFFLKKSHASTNPHPSTLH